MTAGPRLTYYPSGVLLTAPYDAQLTPAMVGELKRLVPAHSRRYLPDTREWFIGSAYEAQARAIFRSCWPHFEEEEGIGADPSQQQPRDPRPPFAEDRHYAALHLLPSAPRELIDSAYRTLSKLHHPDRLPVPEKDRGHRRMVEINGAYEALHAHAASGGD
jgi:hypothetical protein